MKERPILFSGPLVRAILDGRKTQTRRVVRLPCPPDHVSYWDDDGDELCPVSAFGVDGQAWPLARPSPIRYTYGQPGDRLWVRETIRRVGEPRGPERWCASEYAADGQPTVGDCWPWKRNFLPPMHCPRVLSRIDLEVTGVRVERVQDITEEDAMAEGVDPFPFDPEGDCWTDGKHRTAFDYLWGEINGWQGEKSWVENPWVWVVEFRRLRP